MSSTLDADASRQRRDRRPPGSSPRELLGIADHQIDLGHGREQACGSICAAQPVTMMRAPGAAPRPANGLPRLAHRLGRHRAGVEDHGVGKPASAARQRRRLRLIGIEPAAEGDHLQVAHAPAPGRRAGQHALELMGERTGHQNVVVVLRQSMARSPPGNVDASPSGRSSRGGRPPPRRRRRPCRRRGSGRRRAPTPCSTM